MLNQYKVIYHGVGIENTVCIYQFWLCRVMILVQQKQEKPYKLAFMDAFLEKHMNHDQLAKVIRDVKRNIWLDMLNIIRLFYFYSHPNLVSSK